MVLAFRFLLLNLLLFLQGPLVRWLRVNFGEAFIAWIHVKVSVLGSIYGLSQNFASNAKRLCLLFPWTHQKIYDHLKLHESESYDSIINFYVTKFNWILKSRQNPPKLRKLWYLHHVGSTFLDHFWSLILIFQKENDSVTVIFH